MTEQTLVDVTDASLFGRNAFWPMFAWLRRHDPVHRHPEPGGPGFWVVTRHRDVTRVYTDSETFSSRHGMRLGSVDKAVAAVSQRMLIVSDPPEHNRIKSVISKALGHSELPRMERLARAAAARAVDDVLERGEVDFYEVAKRLTNHVICSLMGIPAGEWDWVCDTISAAFEGDDDEGKSRAHSEIFLYFSELLAERREEPGDDFISRIATDQRVAATGGRRPLTDEEIVFNCSGVLSGANETTRFSTAGAVLAFAEHPDQWEQLRSGGDAAVPAALEEVLRWTVPGVHALRTAVRPATIGGVDIAPGDRVTLWNVSANRDEEEFEQADRFLVDRTPNRHVTFGAGRHLCIGARLARLELTVFLSELAGRVRTIELRDRPTYNASNFTWGLSRLAVRLSA
ncbi:cytochrome P450 [Nonomuraea sp. NPDC048826]|uniref:cytochrome P450 n=1 Tax=Nonomuraea sp. NPDC048826 TaxID=3364347 RepID=UPI0037209241